MPSSTKSPGAASRKPRWEPPVLPPDVVADLGGRYWDTEESRQSIRQSAGLTDAEFGAVLPRPATGAMCDVCGGVLEWRSRQGRAAGEARCRDCRHLTSDQCRCATCVESMRRRWDEEERLEEMRRAQAVDAWFVGFAEPDYVQSAVRPLSQPLLLFLDALQHASGAFFWDDIAAQAGVQPWRVDTYRRRLVALRLMFEDDEHIYLNPVLREGRSVLLS